MRKEMRMLGYREGFDWNNRFDLKTRINGFLVSTVDLGIDHSFGIGEPLYYETMIFRDGSWDDLYCKRYSTEEEAREGHLDAIQYVKENLIGYYEGGNDE